jgi:hypothetical protein
MANEGVAQPDFLPALRFRFDDIQVLEAGAIPFGPNNIVTAPNPFTIRMDVGFDGPLTLLLFGLSLTAEHHVQLIETGAVFVLPGGSVTIPAALAVASHLTITSGPFATVVGPAAPGVPLGTGTYRITTHIHPPAPIAGIVAAFQDGLIVEVVS